eukprot:gnl/Spiro4/10805_TR5753_c0_g1_i1.p1 gnl/Spiro4/10805_TR5753_c0_g1~~gnl/Spiro4/10805_TR5753_c0_g1_i1.p1  ORF type:complete len:311 (-),score=32.51 gnl/Spiro4/10805_TR5753_c0_g1_i1:122-1054(-)
MEAYAKVEPVPIPSAPPAYTPVQETVVPFHPRTDELRECRFCHETDGAMIAPCMCSGSIRWVHRECLDEWRSVSQNPLSFSTCDTCHFTYVYDKQYDESCDVAPYATCCMRVSLDLGIALGALLGVVAILSLLVAAGDSNRDIPHYFNDSQHWGVSNWVIYFFWGWIIFFFILGLLGIFLLMIACCCSNGTTYSGYDAHTYPYYRRRPVFICFDGNMYFATGGGSNTSCCICCLPNCSDCKLSGGGGGGDKDGCTALAVIFFIIVACGIIIGLTLAIWFICIVVGKHMSIIYQRQKTGRLVVKDFAANQN